MPTPRQTLTVQLVAANIRIAELEAQLERAHDAHSITIDLLSVARLPKATTPARVAYLARPRATEPSAFQLACAAAKAAAMAKGITTRVAA